MSGGSDFESMCLRSRRPGNGFQARGDHLVSFFPSILKISAHFSQRPRPETYGPPTCTGRREPQCGGVFIFNIYDLIEKETKQIPGPRGPSGYPVFLLFTPNIFLDPKNDGGSDSAIPVAVCPWHRGVNEPGNSEVVSFFFKDKGPGPGPPDATGDEIYINAHDVHN